MGHSNHLVQEKLGNQNISKGQGTRTDSTVVSSTERADNKMMQQRLANSQYCSITLPFRKGVRQDKTTKRQPVGGTRVLAKMK